MRISDRLLANLESAWSQGHRGDLEPVVEILIEIVKEQSRQIEQLQERVGERLPVESMEAGVSVL